MPVSTDLASGLAKGMLDLYADAESRLLVLIAGRIARGLDGPDWAERQLAATSQVLQQTRTIVERLTRSSDATLADAIRRAWNRGAATAGTDMEAIGVARGIAFGGINQSAVAALLDTAHEALQPIGLRIQSSAGQMIGNIVRGVSGLMLAGTMTRRQAAVNVVGRLALAGITGFVDSGGRGWSMTGYAEMVTRSQASQAVVQGHVEQLAQSGYDLVSVSTAPHPCPLCSAWEGRILSMRGFTPTGRNEVRGKVFTVAGTLQYAISQGLMHPQCRHRTMLWTPNFPRVPEHPKPDPEGYKLSQRQRSFERRIRQRKQQIAALNEIDPKSPETLRAKARLKTLTADYTQFVSDNDLKRLRYRESANFGKK